MWKREDQVGWLYPSTRRDKQGFSVQGQPDLHSICGPAKAASWEPALKTEGAKVLEKEATGWSEASWADTDGDVTEELSGIKASLSQSPWFSDRSSSGSSGEGWREFRWENHLYLQKFQDWQRSSARVSVTRQERSGNRHTYPARLEDVLGRNGHQSL